MTDDISIEDLEQHSGLSTRTLHYYMQEGLLPGPDKRGKYATYSREHLDRLDLILVLKEMHMPLKEIRLVLDRLTPSEIKHYLQYQEDSLLNINALRPEPEDPLQEHSKTSSALDYIKSLEDAHLTHERIAESPSPMMFRNQVSPILSNDSVSTIRQPQREMPQEIWRRIALSEGIELHYRDTRDTETRYKIDRLLSFAQSLFEK